MSISVTLPETPKVFKALAEIFQQLADQEGGPVEDTGGVVNPPKTGDTTSATQLEAADTTEITPARDADGLPWDARIHSSNHKTVKKTGKWQRRKNISDELVSAVEAELRGAPTPPPAIDPTPTNQPATEAPAAPPPPPPAIDPTPTNQPATEAPAAPPPPPPPPSSTAAPNNSTVAMQFNELCQKMQAANIPMETRNAVAQANGLDSITSLISRPELVPTIAMGLGLQ